MSYRSEKFLSLLGKNLDDLNENELKEISRNILDDGLHGICFSLYEDGQEPGNDITDEQIISRLEILKPHTKWIRTFSSLEEHGRIAKFAKGLGFKTLVGAWLSSDLNTNEEELSGFDTKPLVGHLAAWNYFMSADSEENDKGLLLTGKYGLRPDQLKFGNDKKMTLTTDSNVKSYLLVTEFRRK